LKSIQAKINDINAANSDVKVQGLASGDLGELLDYIKPTPILLKRPTIAQLLAVRGPADLSVDLVIPLSGSKDPDLDIRLTLLGNQIQWSDFPPLVNAKGSLRIQDDFPIPETLRADFLGGEVKATGQPSRGAEKLFTIAGGINTNELKKHLIHSSDSNLISLINAMTGRINYEGQVRLENSNVESNLRLNLNAFGLGAPEPLKKEVNTPLTGRLSLKSNADLKSGGTAFSWSGQIGDRMFTEGSSSSGSSARQAYSIGTPAILPQNGIAFALNTNEFDLDAWQSFLKPTSPVSAADQKESGLHSQRAANSKVPIQVNAQIKKLTLFNRVWPDLQLSANHTDAQLQLHIASPLMAGQMHWQP